MDQIVCNNLLKLEMSSFNMQHATCNNQQKTEPRLCELLHSTLIRGFQIPENLEAVVAVTNITLA